MNASYNRSQSLMSAHDSPKNPNARARNRMSIANLPLSTRKDSSAAYKKSLKMRENAVRKPHEFGGTPSGSRKRDSVG